MVVGVVLVLFSLWFGFLFDWVVVSVLGVFCLVFFSYSCLVGFFDRLFLWGSVLGFEFWVGLGFLF